MIILIKRRGQKFPTGRLRNWLVLFCDGGRGPPFVPGTPIPGNVFCLHFLPMLSDLHPYSRKPRALLTQETGFVSESMQYGFSCACLPHEAIGYRSAVLPEELSLYELQVLMSMSDHVEDFRQGVSTPTGQILLLLSKFYFWSEEEG